VTIKFQAISKPSRFSKDSDSKLSQLLCCPKDDWCSRKPLAEMGLDELSSLTAHANSILGVFSDRLKDKPLSKWTLHELSTLQCPRCKTKLLQANKTFKVSYRISGRLLPDFRFGFLTSLSCALLQ
jgi:uncharacterized protein YbaR (Trm112 family)